MGGRRSRTCNKLTGRITGATEDVRQTHARQKVYSWDFESVAICQIKRTNHIRELLEMGSRRIYAIWLVNEKGPITVCIKRWSHCITVFIFLYPYESSFYTYSMIIITTHKNNGFELQKTIVVTCPYRTYSLDEISNENCLIRNL